MEIKQQTPKTAMKRKKKSEKFFNYFEIDNGQKQLRCHSTDADIK